MPTVLLVSNAPTAMTQLQFSLITCTRVTRRTLQQTLVTWEFMHKLQSYGKEDVGKSRKRTKATSRAKILRTRRKNRETEDRSSWQKKLS